MDPRGRPVKGLGVRTPRVSMESGRHSSKWKMRAEELGLIAQIFSADRDLCMSEQIYRLVLVRFLVVLAIAGGVLFSEHVVGVAGMNHAALYTIAGLLLLCNVATMAVNRPYRAAPKPNPGAQPFLHGLMHVTVGVDFLFLAAALYFVGGAQSPFQAFFIFHVIIASVLLSPAASMGYALVGYLLLAALTVGTWLGWLPPQFPEGAVPSQSPLDGRYVFTVLVVNGLLFALVAALMNGLMRLLRRNMHVLYDTSRELERLSHLRRDFLHIAMHNLRSPIGVVSMHMSNMLNGYGGDLTEKQRNWVTRSQTRLGELQAFLNDLEFLTALDSDSLEKQGHDFDLCELLSEIAVEYQDLAAERCHDLLQECPDEHLKVHGVPRLVHEMVVNFITNAVKYTPVGGRIVIRALSRGEWVRIEVEDNGIGISEADQKRLFDEFVRFKQGAEVLGDVHGSGLGLSIVHRIAKMHGGRVDVVSELGKGSIFAIELPANAPKAE